MVKAITKAEESLASGEKVYSLGDIVHNRVEVQRLESLGLETVSHADFPQLIGRTVLIRAHGEPPSTYELAQRHRLKVIDATCPVVAHLQKVVVEAHRKMQECGGQVVILGKRGHAEVVGLTGQVAGDTLVVERLETRYGRFQPTGLPAFADDTEPRTVRPDERGDSPACGRSCENNRARYHLPPGVEP